MLYLKKKKKDLAKGLDSSCAVRRHSRGPGLCGTRKHPPAHAHVHAAKQAEADEGPPEACCPWPSLAVPAGARRGHSEGSQARGPASRGLAGCESVLSPGAAGTVSVLAAPSFLLPLVDICSACWEMRPPRYHRHHPLPESATRRARPRDRKFSGVGLSRLRHSFPSRAPGPG